MTTAKPNDKKCCTCQSWKGERRYDARSGRVFYDNSLSCVSAECNMKYKKTGANPANNCRGYVRWVELP